jgi:hypothetical protein
VTNISTISNISYTSNTSNISNNSNLLNPCRFVKRVLADLSRDGRVRLAAYTSAFLSGLCTRYPRLAHHYIEELVALCCYHQVCVCVCVCVFVCMFVCVHYFNTLLPLRRMSVFPFPTPPQWKPCVQPCVLREGASRKGVWV